MNMRVRGSRASPARAVVTQKREMEMDDNVVLVAFTEQSKAYQALSRLRQAADTGPLEVRAAALLERGPDGVVRVPERMSRFDSKMT